MNGYCNYSSLDWPFKSAGFDGSAPLRALDSAARERGSLLDLRSHLGSLPTPEAKPKVPPAHDH